MLRETQHPARFTAADEHAMRAAVDRIVAQTPIFDLHTHIYAPAFGELLLWGVDELLTYHYLIAEFMRVSDTPYAAFFAMPKREQAGLIWRELFLKRAPCSEACRGALTSLHKLGLDVSARDLDAYRAYFAEQNPADHLDTVFRVAGIKAAVMTNDPFDNAERPVWESGYTGDQRFRAALRIDPLLNDWPAACERLKAWGYSVEPRLGANTLAGIRHFLEDWLKRMQALYMAVSLPPDFMFPENTPRGAIIAECVTPVAREHHIPFAMMIGVKRAVNPALQLAGDGVGHASIEPIERMCGAYPDNKFMVTMLARENQHELCVAARKFRNLHVFGCWWFLNNPSLIEEITRMRLEMLGFSVTPQHSDARVLDQLIYKWDHSRRIIANVLADKYADILAAGWTLAEAEIRRDAEKLLGGAFLDFLRSG